MRNYAIYYDLHTKNGIIKMFLTNTNHEFGYATNFTFKTVQDAITFIKTNNVQGPIATQLRIRGPRLGVYSSVDGRLIR